MPTRGSFPPHHSKVESIVPYCGGETVMRALIVVSSYKPAMVADMQRARMLAWELPLLGWDVEILSPGSAEVRQDIIETGAEAFFPPATPIHEVGSFARRAFEMLGSNSPAWRTLGPLFTKGRRLLGAGHYDIVFFSTTTFNYFWLGKLWQREFGIPFILDFHDPWVRERSAFGPGLKSRVAHKLSACMERVSTVNAAGLVAVSPGYLDTLKRRYGAANPAWLAPRRSAVIPIGAHKRDLAEAAKTAGRPCGMSKELAIHYVGAGGSIMSRSFAVICRALSFLRSEKNPLVERVRIRLFGTTYNWRPGDAKVLEDAASEYGVEDLVCEHPERVSYRRSLELLLEGDGALVLGVDDAGYMPSKLFSYALSGKPLLAVLHRDSRAFSLFQGTPELGHALWFDYSGEMSLRDAARVMHVFLEEAAARRTFDRGAVLESFLAPAMARRHAELFNACVESK